MSGYPCSGEWKSKIDGINDFDNDDNDYDILVFHEEKILHTLGIPIFHGDLFLIKIPQNISVAVKHVQEGKTMHMKEKKQCPKDYCWNSPSRPKQ